MMNTAPRPTTEPGTDTLAALLKADRVPMETLHAKYGPVLELVRTLIGVVPNCDPYLEIWPTAFRSYNVMVPNLLNLPFSVFGFGAASGPLMGLAMYVSSRTAECPYCTAHSCSFALRRGASAAQVAAAFVDGSDALSPSQLATVAVARSLASGPVQLTRTERDALLQHLSADEAEWVVLSVAMMGFLNKFMDGLGVELEASTVAETKTILGPAWSPRKAGRDLDPALAATPAPQADTLWTKARVVPLAPGALRLDGQWQAGVPDSAAAIGPWLQARTGHDFPVLARLRAKRAIRAMATMIRDNLDPQTSVVGLETKILAGAIYAATVEDEQLLSEMRVLATHHGISPERLAAAVQFEAPANDAILQLARAASTSPARVDADIVEQVRQVGIAPAAIVELITWLSVLQMLHRLTAWFAVAA